MTDTLLEICAQRRKDVAARAAETPLTVLEARLQDAPPPRGFVDALEERRSAGAYAVIAEIKRASPSKGLIRADFDPASLAAAYQKGGATCLSVLTEPHRFDGADAHLVAARTACNLPVLRKDFTVSRYQIAEARALGADCILLIVAALTETELRAYWDYATALGLDVLVEVHDRAELDRALAIPARLVGINNRNLRTLQVDLQTSIDLAPLIPSDRLAVCESGLSGRAELDRMAAAGISSFLIGESLMRQPDVGAALTHLLTPLAA